MTIRNLNSVFKPASVAVLGASERAGTLGRILLENVLADFAGPVYPVNPGHDKLLGHPAYRSVEDIPGVPDFAVIATPPAAVPGLVDALARKGTRGVCVITAGFGPHDDDGPAMRQAILDAAKPHLVRIVGPNCVGLQVPSVGLNASFAPVMPKAGGLAFVAQSGAVITAVLDWAYPRDIGFSHVVSVGDMADVDFGDMLDYLARDPDTEAILLYIEAVTHPRKFLSAARAAARTKPVIVVKAGRQVAGARAAASHTGALAGMDAVYDAVFQRAGMLRVLTLEELFDVVETLAVAKPPQTNELTILTNGGGLGVLAADALMAEGGKLAELQARTIAELNEVLPVTWSHGNPVDIIGDANGDRYARALKILLEAEEVQSLLVLNCPTALASSDEVAQAVLKVIPEDLNKTLLTSWTGEHSTQQPRARFQAMGLPTYDTPEEAVHAFTQMADYRHRQNLLLQIPPSLPDSFKVDTAAARQVIDEVLMAKRSWLTEPEAKAVLQAYGIPIVKTKTASSPAAASRLAANMGIPVAIKILSGDITHKSDVGGVALDVEPANAQTTAQAMLERVTAAVPDADIDGFSVQPMIDRAASHELIVGMINDRQFGPVMLFGHGGTAVEILDDKALALPPLNLSLARDMITHTRIYSLLRGYRDVPAADLDEVALTLVRLSHLVVDLANIEEVDINPLLANANGVVALDARIKVAPSEQSGAERLAIRPYPSELEEKITLTDGTEILVRPVRPQDDTALRGRFSNLPEILAMRLTQIDYDRQMVLVLTEPTEPREANIYAVARLLEDPDRTQGQVAMAVADGYAQRGMGSALLQRLVAYARERGLSELNCQTHQHNVALLSLLRTAGFTADKEVDSTAEIKLRLHL